MKMLTRKKREKTEFFKAEVAVKKRKKESYVIKKQSTKPNCRPLKRIRPYENLLVWAKFKGVGWWPGRIADRIELSGPLDLPEDSTRWINWFGDNKYTEIHIDQIAAFHDFTRFFQRSKFDRNIMYRTAVTEALDVACARSGQNFSTNEAKIIWALQDFLPGGYLLFMPKVKEDVKHAEGKVSKGMFCSKKPIDGNTESEFLIQRNRALVHVRSGLSAIQDICLGCGDQDAKIEHPCFEGGLCEACKTDYIERMYCTDRFGNASYCCVCSGGKKVVHCDSRACNKCICTECIRELSGQSDIKQEVQKKIWICYLCRKFPCHGLLKRRRNWMELLQNFSSDCADHEYITLFPNYACEERRKIKVLSLFDGIAVGMVALKELNFNIEGYYASEIDQSCLYISQANHPEIQYVGDVKNIDNKVLMNWGPFDLLIGGSPCNDLAIVNPVRKGLWSEEGSGPLFFEYCRILNACSIMAAIHHRPFFWLFENVVHMDTPSKATITRFLERAPVLLDAKFISPAKRPRLFWGNLPGMQRPVEPGPNDKLTLQECMEPCRIAKETKIGTITTNSKTISKKANRDCLPFIHTSQKICDMLWIIEIERVFGLPDHYTDKSNLSSSARRRVLGRAWSVPIIKHLLSPLRDCFLLND